jgi:hypothetical protein
MHRRRAGRKRKRGQGERESGRGAEEETTFYSYVSIRQHTSAYVSIRWVAGIYNM